MGAYPTMAKMIDPHDLDIVVMEDDAESFSRIRETLADLGLKVIKADNVESAIQIAHHGSAKHFLLDVNMGPGRHEEGLDALEALKRYNQDLRVGIYTAYPHVFHKALRAGADILVRKTDVKPDLEKIVTTLLERDAEKPDSSISEFVERSLQNNSFTNKELESGLRDFEYSGLVGVDGKPLEEHSSEYKYIIAHVENANEEIFKKIRLDPALMRSLTPREFEEFVGDLLKKLGYEVTLTPASRDGGFDMYAASSNALGSFLYLVECKKYEPQNKVGVEIVRSLYGVLESKKATAGMVVTSSFFTKGAEDFQQQVMYKVHLHDYLKIQKWLDLI